MWRAHFYEKSWIGRWIYRPLASASWLVALILMISPVLVVLAARIWGPFRHACGEGDHTCIFIGDYHSAVEWYRLDNEGACPEKGALVGRYLKYEPNDEWGREMRLTCDPEHSRVTSAGPDGRFDTEDDLDPDACRRRHANER